MTDKPEDEGPERCVACDIAFNVLMVLGVAFVAFMAWDTLSQGRATEIVTGAFRRMGPKLAVVQPIRGQDEPDAGRG